MAGFSVAAAAAAAVIAAAAISPAVALAAALAAPSAIACGCGGDGPQGARGAELEQDVSRSFTVSLRQVGTRWGPERHRACGTMRLCVGDERAGVQQIHPSRFNMVLQSSVHIYILTRHFITHSVHLSDFEVYLLQNFHRYHLSCIVSWMVSPEKGSVSKLNLNA
jgi:hypothetical protein